MSCCCDCFLDSGCIMCNELFDTKQKATQAGVHILRYKFMNTYYDIESGTIALNQNIKFDVSGLIFNYTFEGKIIKPNGEEFQIMDDEIDYDCLRFRVEMNVKYADTGS